MSRVGWLVMEVVLGALLAGIVVGAGVGVSVEAGYPARPWMVWVGAALCIGLAIWGGESMRRQRTKA